MQRHSILLAVAALALTAAACGDGDGLTGGADRAAPSTRRRVSTTSTSTTTTTTTTVPPTAPPTAPPEPTIAPPDSERPGASCASPEAAANSLYGGYVAGDQAAAGACATPQAVSTLFDRGPHFGKPATLESCQIVGGQQRFECFVLQEGGGYQFDVEQAPQHGGWYVDEVHQIS